MGARDLPDIYAHVITITYCLCPTMFWLKSLDCKVIFRNVKETVEQ